MYNFKMAERSTQVELAAVGLSLDDRDLRMKQFDSRIDGPRRVESVEIQTMTNGVGINGENKENEECSKTVKPPNPAAGPSRMVWVPVVPPNQGQPKIGHMVQNQMTPSYQYAQAGLEDYHHQVQTDLDGEVQATTTTTVASPSSNSGPKRLHVSNIPFRFREADLRQLLAFGPILDVEIIFNERGSKGFGFVTFANSADADRAREKLNGTVVEGRKIEVNNATARVMTKKTPAPTIPNAAALRGVALTRGRAAAARGAYTAAAAAAAAAFRHPAPLATAATALPYTAGVYQDPFLAATAYPERYQVGNVLVTSQPYAAGYPATAARYAIPTVASAATYAAAAGYGRDYAADPYLGHSIGPVAGFGATVYGRAGYQRYAPY
ncbi:RNA binding protein fox-1 homolog 2-like isoform X6 [Liolophura sinensis]|uniref:RNA binding protein fox-1 homolog 2-like isoform X6 n=1 Tax=Liolophura sinensis TaxID=3198878 RepID=UPI0031595E9F